MKRQIIPIAVLSILLALTGCGTDTGGSAAAPSGTETTTAAAESTAVTATGSEPTNFDPITEYIGTWQSESQWNGCDFIIQVSKYDERLKVDVTAHSAVADYEWNYICTCSEDNTYIDCPKGGVLIRTDHAANGDMLEPVEVYDDGIARFSMKGGCLFWQECKEDTARQVCFRKNG